MSHPATRLGTGNRSPAVMQRRRSAPSALDYFPTPPFATRALCEFLAGKLGELGRMTVWEPACGEGHMARPLLEHFGAVRMSDVYRYPLPQGLGEHELLDFAFFGREEPAVDAVITNPPFALAQAFIDTALKVSRRAVAILVRSAFLEGEERYRTLWTRTPPTYVLQFSERVVMLEGRLVKRNAVDPLADREGAKASSATAYVWLVWLLTGPGEPFLIGGDTSLRWIAPSLDRLERPGDYPDYSQAAAPAGLFAREALD